VAITSIIAFVLAFVNIGNPTAFNGVVSLTIAALFGSYLLASGLLLFRRLKGDIGAFDNYETDAPITNTIGGKLTWGPWKIPGIAGTANNIFACCYLIFIFFFSFWPSKVPVTPQSMNWAILVTGVVVVFSTLYYIVWGKRTYAGPVVEADECRADPQGSG
jgi:hypothetical protein